MGTSRTAIAQVAGGSSGLSWPLTFLSRPHHTLWASVFLSQMALVAWHSPLAPFVTRRKECFAWPEFQEVDFCS